MTTVLHIDDDPEWREIVHDYLTKKGVTVISIASIGKAKAVLVAQQVDAIVCDGNIDARSDGTVFAEQQAKLGCRVIAFCGLQESYKIPYADKGRWLNGEREKILAFVTGS